MGTIERSALYINCSSFHFSFLSQFNPSFLTLHKHTLELTLWACSTTNQMRLRLTMRSVFSPLFQFIELIVPWYLFSAGTLNTRQSYLTRSLLLLHLTRYIANVYPPSNHTLIISFPYQLAKAYEHHVEKNGKPVSHAKAKEVLYVFLLST